MDGKTARGASSPAKPAFTSPEPLSHTRAVVSSSSHILAQLRRGLQVEERGKTYARGLRSWPSVCPGKRGQSRRDRADGSACHLPSLRGRRRRVERSGGGWGCGCVGKERGPAHAPTQAPWPGAHPLSQVQGGTVTFLQVPSPFHKVVTPLGPIHAPMHAHAGGEAHEIRDLPWGTAGLPFRAPLSCDDPGQNEVEPRRKVLS